MNDELWKVLCSLERENLVALGACAIYSSGQSTREEAINAALQIFMDVVKISSQVNE